MKIIKTQKCFKIEKIAQFGDEDLYNDPDWGADDAARWEEERVWEDISQGEGREFETEDFSEDEEKITIEPFFNHLGVKEGYKAVKHGIYEQDSVLEGQPRYQVIDFGSLEELKKKYPDADVVEHSTKPDVRVSTSPPRDFDPADAGERWDENY